MSQPWSDEDYGFVQDHMDWPVARVAETLGRTEVAIRSARYKLRKGWSPQRDAGVTWAASDDAFLIENPHLTAAQAAVKLERTESSIRQRWLHLRRNLSSTPAFNGNYSPFKPGARPLLAKTCPECGLLLQAKWFQVTDGAWYNKCKRCRPSEESREKSRPSKEAARAFYDAMQAATIEGAENHGKLWTESEMVVLADPDMTVFGKAIALKRTFASVHAALQKHGIRSAVWLGDPVRDQWIIDNPNAGRVEEILAQFKSITDDIEMPEPELVTAGAPKKRPEFDWDE